MKQPIVSVGIVAYNEERNIEAVIHDVLAQKTQTWKLNKVYVATDGSSDNTVQIVAGIRDKRIILLRSRTRKGKPANEQKIFSAFTGDILVMFDADVRLASNKLIEKLIEPMRSGKKVMLTGGNPMPYPPETFIEKAVYTTFMALDLSRTSLHGGHNIYGASGQCLALTRQLVQRVKFPARIIAEDDYIFFTNRKFGWNFRHVRSAIVYYKLPRTLGDYFRQTQRSDPYAAIHNVEKYFSINTVRNEYVRPISFYVFAISRALKYNFLGTIFILLVRIVSRIASVYTSRHYNLGWFTAHSTK